LFQDNTISQTVDARQTEAAKHDAQIKKADESNHLALLLFLCERMSGLALSVTSWIFEGISSAPFPALLVLVGSVV
jgi:hypothetical protein